MSGVLHEADQRSVNELAQEENDLLIGLLRLRAQASDGASTGRKEELAA